MEKSHTLLELEKIEEKYRAEYLQAESIWNVSRNNMIRQALKEGWSYPITELERYTGKRIDEIAVVFCNEDGLRRKVKILNTDSDNFISVKDSGYLDWISVNSWGDIEAEDYEEYIFSEDVGNGIMMCSDTGECIAGFLVRITEEAANGFAHFKRLTSFLSYVIIRKNGLFEANSLLGVW